jgi:hypothetical protein
MGLSSLHRVILEIELRKPWFTEWAIVLSKISGPGRLYGHSVNSRAALPEKADGALNKYFKGTDNMIDPLNLGFTQMRLDSKAEPDRRRGRKCACEWVWRFHGLHQRQVEKPRRTI